MWRGAADQEKRVGKCTGGGRSGGGKRDSQGGGNRRKRGKLCNIAQYFAIAKMQRGDSQQIQGGNQD